MPIVIQDECVNCAICVDHCAPRCILEDEDQFVVDHEHCTGCGECIPVCPVGCILKV